MKTKKDILKVLETHRFLKSKDFRKLGNTKKNYPIKRLVDNQSIKENHIFDGSKIKTYYYLPNFENLFEEFCQKNNYSKVEKFNNLDKYIVREELLSESDINVDKIVDSFENINVSKISIEEFMLFGIYKNTIKPKVSKCRKSKKKQKAIDSKRWKRISKFKKEEKQRLLKKVLEDFCR
jgi:hypothetical protein